MKINAKIERFEGYSRFLGYGYVKILFYGTLSCGENFKLEVDFDEDGNYKKDSDVRKEDGWNIEKNPSVMVDIGKVYEKVLYLQGDKVKEIFNKASEIKCKYRDLEREIDKEIEEVEKPLDLINKEIEELIKKSRRLKREDKISEINNQIEVAKKSRKTIADRYEDLEKSKDDLYYAEKLELSNITIEL